MGREASQLGREASQLGRDTSQERELGRKLEARRDQLGSSSWEASQLGTLTLTRTLTLTL